MLITQDSWLHVGGVGLVIPGIKSYQAQQLQGVWRGCVTSPGGLGLLGAIL